MSSAVASHPVILPIAADAALDAAATCILAAKRPLVMIGAAANRSRLVTLQRALEQGGVQLLVVPIDYSVNQRVLVDELKAHRANKESRP